jgi:hypothetical protein
MNVFGDFGILFLSNDTLSSCCTSFENFLIERASYKIKIKNKIKNIPYKRGVLRTSFSLWGVTVL